MTGWGREHAGQFQKALALTGLTGKQVKVSYTTTLIGKYHTATGHAQEDRKCQGEKGEKDDPGINQSVLMTQYKGLYGL